MYEIFFFKQSWKKNKNKGTFLLRKKNPTWWTFGCHEGSGKKLKKKNGSMFGE